MLPASLAAGTQIQDTGHTGISGVLFIGKILISAPDMTTADGRTVFRWQQEYTIANGVIFLDLEPNDTASPVGTSYTVRYTPSKGAAWTERWLIPSSETPLKVNQVRIAVAPTPSLTIQPSQILGGGAASGECLAWTGSSWAPSACGAVSTVFGRSGAVAAQTGDYSFSQISGTVGGTQIAAGVDASKIGAGAVDNTTFGYLAGVTGSIQGQLAARPTGSGSPNALAYWSGSAAVGGSPYFILDEAARTMSVKAPANVYFTDAGGGLVSWIYPMGSRWVIDGFDFWNVGALSLNTYMQAPGYRVASDFSATTISSSNYDFGKLFDGEGNGYRRFKLTTSVTSPVFDFSITQPSYITVLEICQDATGGRTITFPSNVAFGPLNTAANKCTVQMMISRTMSSSPWIGAFPLAPAVSF